jgi:hypothetical protein
MSSMAFQFAICRGTEVSRSTLVLQAPYSDYPARDFGCSTRRSGFYESRESSCSRLVVPRRGITRADHGFPSTRFSRSTAHWSEDGLQPGKQHSIVSAHLPGFW